LVSDSHLKCRIEPAVINAVTKIYCNTNPVKVMLNGKENNLWSYNKLYKILTIDSKEVSSIEVFLK
jgi:hypothetical protein